MWTAAALSLMVLIFWFSAQNGMKSSAQSGFIRQLLSWLSASRHMEHYLRKSAHFSIYFFLGFSIFKCLHFWSVPKTKALQAALAVCLCLLYAGSDEFHQLFVPGRDGSLADVLLDGCGGLSGSCLSCLFTFRFHDY
ncbi:MAG: VanZ family protein [Erysipelotrichaceae bacterium]|nr:VanZ family protein [Erysipelotrichaceae bacterium]